MSRTLDYPMSERYLTDLRRSDDVAFDRALTIPTERALVIQRPSWQIKGWQWTGGNLLLEGQSDILPMMVTMLSGSTQFACFQVVLVRNDDWLAEYTDTPDDIRAFCVQHGIESHLKDAVDLVNKCFPSAVRLRIELRQDPEEESEWLVLRASVKGGVKDVLKAYDGYIDQWVKLAPPEVRGMIRLSYNLAR